LRPDLCCGGVLRGLVNVNRLQPAFDGQAAIIVDRPGWLSIFFVRRAWTD
jgi:hypothetical protein